MKIGEAAAANVYPVPSGAAQAAGKENTAKKPDGSPEAKKSNPAYKEDVLGKIIDDLNKKLNPAGRELRYSIHKKTGQVMVKVVDTESGKTIREIPPEKSLDILAKILEQSGLLVDEKT